MPLQGQIVLKGLIESQKFSFDISLWNGNNQKHTHTKNKCLSSHLVRCFYISAIYQSFP